MYRLSSYLVGFGMLLLLIASPTWAHPLKFTGVRVQFNAAQTLVSVTVHLHTLQGADPAQEIPRRLKLRIDGEPFVATKTHLSRDTANGIAIWQGEQPRLRHDSATKGALPQVVIEAPFFPEVPADSTVVTVIKDRQVFAEAVVDANHPSAILRTEEDAPTNPGASGVVGRFFREGIAHIFGGIDHVLFLLSLLLLGGSLKQLLKIVTAFTLAHSITLSLSATGILSLPPRLVEPVIALSIVLVALSNLRAAPSEGAGRTFDIRPLMAFGFGLIHGFGFAGALSEIGLPREALGWALVAFNMGVEVGQAALVLLFAPPLLGVAKKWPSLQMPLVRYGSATVALVGGYWFLERVFVA